MAWLMQWNKCVLGVLIIAALLWTVVAIWRNRE